MRTRHSKRGMLTAAITLTACTAAAYINPGFTPAHLTEQAHWILLVKLKLTETGDAAEVQVLRQLAAEDTVPAGPITITLSGSAVPEQAKTLRERIRTFADEPALLMTGKGEAEAGQEDRPEISYLHLAGAWYELGKGSTPGTFDFIKRDAHMEGTWAGSTDMLAKIIEFQVKHPENEVPVAAGAAWADPVKLCTLEGNVTECRAVDLDNSGRLFLYFGCTGGDRLFACEAGSDRLVDRTAALGLSAKSRVSTWADLNGDGRLDLASWDGKSLSVVLQKAGGAFEPAKAATGAPEGECLGLLPACRGEGGRSGLLWSSPRGPVLLKPGQDVAAFTAVPISAGKTDLAALGAPGRCLLADFNCDGLPDVLFPLTKGSLLFAGKADGTFAEATSCTLALDQAPASCFTGDYDMDGRLDVCTLSNRGEGLWQNRPGAKPDEVVFEEMAFPRSDSENLCGEMSYIKKEGGLWGNTCDINNDGLQDTFWVYSEAAETGPHIFFNRGFRSFGHGHEVDISEGAQLATAEKDGQQHGIVADLNSDGAQDMAVVLKNGNAYFFRQDAGFGRPCLRVALPPGVPGPVRVTAWETAESPDKTVHDVRCLGAWNVLPGIEEAFLGVQTPGTTLRLSWQLPGSDKPVERSEITEDKPLRIVIE